MADAKISALAAASALDGSEVYPVVQGGSTKKAPPDTIIRASVVSGSFTAAGGKGRAYVASDYLHAGKLSTNGGSLTAESPAAYLYLYGGDNVHRGGNVVISGTPDPSVVAYGGRMTLAGGNVTSSDEISGGNGGGFQMSGGNWNDGTNANNGGTAIFTGGSNSAGGDAILRGGAATGTDGTVRLQKTAGSDVVVVSDTGVGFYGTAPVAQQTGVAVTAAAIHAALVNLGLITA